jgi:hypothetical protein
MMAPSPNGRWLDSTEVVNGKTIEEVMELWKAGKLWEEDSQDHVDFDKHMRMVGWSHSTDPVKGALAKEKCPNGCINGRICWPDDHEEDCQRCNATGFIYRPLTRAERDEKFGEMVTYIRQDICRDCPSDCDDVEYYPCATVKALTIGKSEIVNEEEGE